ncbi:general transcription factor II-I repeat domain-containing protein 2A-like [Styela clava]
MRSDKYESTRRSLESLRKLFTKKFAENETVNHASHKIVTKLVEREKPFTDGAFIKYCILEAVNYLCPEKVNLFTGRSLSPSSVVRKVEELGANVKQQIRDKVKNFLWYSLALDESTDVSSTSQLLIFIRGVDTKLNITEELVSVCSMHGTAIGEDIFKEVQKTLQDYNLQWNQLRCVTVDGRKNMAEVMKGLVGQIHKQLEDLQLPKRLVIHCIIHQQALCGKDLDVSCVLKPVTAVVNFIRSHGLNHRQFQGFFEDIDSDFSDLPYHTAVRWLSCGRVLSRFYKLRREIEQFLIEKNRADPQLSDLA